MASPSPSRKRSHSDMKSGTPTTVMLDEQAYRDQVLRLPNAVTEDDIDDRISNEAQLLGLLPPQPFIEVEGITSSLSATTIASDPNHQGSILSQSTAPTSCSSSEHRPTAQSPEPSMKGKSQSFSHPSSILSEAEKKRDSGFRRGFRKMTTFKKRRSLGLSSSTLTSINSDSADTHESDRTSIKSGMKSPTSIKSSKSSWSSPMPPSKSSYEPHTPIDHEALRRSMECEEILGLRTTQLDERARFVDFQNSLLAEVRALRDSIKAEKSKLHRAVLEEQEKKNEKSVEELEARQLEEEMKMQKDHDAEKRTAMVRLRHMEAYCQNPTPPPTPVDPVSGRPSMDSFLPERKVTDKDYHNLAQQYRERDAMENLHASKINVLRGTQKKMVENLVRKREMEIDKLEAKQQKELDQVDKVYGGQENILIIALNSRRSRLERRWRMQALIERTKVEKSTGLKHAALPDVTATGDTRPATTGG